MHRPPRRAFLRGLGVAGALGLSGCQESFSEDTPTSTEPQPTATTTDQPQTATPTTTPGARIRFETSVEEGDAEMHLRVSGEIAAARGVNTARVRAGETTAQFDAGGADTYTLDANLPVTGGRAYQVTVSVIDADGNEFAKRKQTDHVPIAIDPVQTNRLVGAHYYPWYGTNEHHSDWADRAVSTSVLGEYSVENQSVVDQHIKWSLEHGIRWWSVSWWGPTAPTNRALKETLTNAEQFEHLTFSILYETKGRLEEFDYDLDRQAARDRLADDLAYLAEHYFAQDNYRRIDGRPVVFFYIAQTLKGDITGAFAEATADLDTELYVLADLPFGNPPASYPVVDAADAVTSYNPYTPREDIEQVFHDRYGQGLKMLHLGAETADLDYVPVLIPGFNDTGIPSSLREDNPVLSASPDRYARVCEQVRPYLADAESVLVTSFNEWYENTQIEPNEEYETAYLELTRDRLATVSSSGVDLTGQQLRFIFNKALVPAEINPDSSDDRHLAFMAAALEFRAGQETIASFNIGSSGDEPIYLKGAYNAASNDSQTWRWFGGPDAETILFVDTDVSEADTVVLTGQPMKSNAIEADVYFDESKTDHVAFEERDGEFDDYLLSLSTS